MGKNINKNQLRIDFTAALFLLPFLSVWLLLLIFPLIKGIWMSLNDWDIVSGRLSKSFGFYNYIDLYYDPLFWQALKNTLIFVFFTVASVTIVSLLLAVALNREGRVYGFFRSIFFASSVLSVTVVTLIWIMMFNKDRGLIAAFVEFWGGEGFDWLTSPHLAMPAIIITTIWWGLGLPFMLFLAGLQQIPQDMNDAARLEGIKSWQKLWYITLPQLRRTVILVIITQTVLHFQVFGQAAIMTKGGPSGATRTLVQYIYDNGIRQPDMMGYASALAMILLLIMVFASFVQMLTIKEDK